MITDALHKLFARADLTRDECAAALADIVDGRATPAQIGAFLGALRVKGETADEIAGAAALLRERAEPVRVRAPVFVDTCGTGGDGLHTFNISTAAAFVVAAAGVVVAKHGNRAASSACGSADVLAALGAKVDLPKEAVEACLERAGIGFLFAPRLHPAFKAVAGARRELGARTLFNLLGPLVNPARPRHQVVGVYAPEWVPVLGRALCELGAERAFVVHGGGADEVSVTGETRVCEAGGGATREYTLGPEDLGLGRWAQGELKGGDAATNARILREVLGGQKGAPRDAVLASAALALVAAGAADSPREGARRGAEALDGGGALERLEAFVRVTNEVGA
ncbi:MAG TPA: anthranilate phosphoribosyltransferase [Polyangiaceae bacterium]|nr:anthranilate phosphoribosyltransferase [Polyangiaceae bacterium]